MGKRWYWSLATPGSSPEAPSILTAFLSHSRPLRPRTHRHMCTGGTRSEREHMPTEIQRDEVRRMVASGTRLVEVLPAEEYEAEHLPGAINIPLPQLDRRTTAVLHQDQPVIVYCYDLQ